MPFCEFIHFFKHNAINFTKYWSLHVFMFQVRSILHLTLASGQTYCILDTSAIRTVGHKALLAVTWINVQPFQWYYMNMHDGKISKYFEIELYPQLISRQTPCQFKYSVTLTLRSSWYLSFWFKANSITSSNNSISFSNKEEYGSLLEQTWISYTNFRIAC